MAELAAAKVILRLAWQLFAPRVGEKLQKGDPAVEAIRNYLLTEFQKIHEHLNALRRKELAAAVHYIENGYTLLKSDQTTSIAEFKKARDAAHVAFGVVGEMPDKLLAMKVAVLSTLHEFQENLETCGNLCLKYLERLNSMPEVVKAAEHVFEKSTGGKLLSFTGKAARREVLEGTAVINKAAWDYFQNKGILDSMRWPLIKLGTKSVHPVFDLVLFRTPKLIGTLEDSFDGITTAVLENNVFYIAGSNKSAPNTIAVCERGGKEVKYLVGHSGMILCLLITDKLLFSGSFDKTIMVWDVTSLECKHILTGHSGSVRSLAKSKRFLYSGATDCQMLVWDVESLTQLESLDARKPVLCIKPSRKKFVFALTSPASVLIWLVGEENHTFLRKIEVPMSTKDIFMADKFMLAIAKDRVEVWNLGSFTTEATIVVNAFKIYLCASGRYVITDSGNGNLQQFEIRDGKLVFQDVCAIGNCSYSPEVMWNNDGSMYAIVRGSHPNDFNLLCW